MFIKNVTSV